MSTFGAYGLIAPFILMGFAGIIYAMSPRETRKTKADHARARVRPAE